jgi:hypothetical protein
MLIHHNWMVSLLVLGGCGYFEWTSGLILCRLNLPDREGRGSYRILVTRPQWWLESSVLDRLVAYDRFRN